MLNRVFARSRLLRYGLVATLAFTLGSASIAYGLVASGVISACYNNASGILRVATAAAPCIVAGNPILTYAPLLLETQVAWNQVGPQGLKGDTGATGASGPQGPAGPLGPKGATGATGPSGAPGGSTHFSAEGLSAVPGETLSSKSLTLPAGKYLVQASGVLKLGSLVAGNKRYVTCRLVARGLGGPLVLAENGPLEFVSVAGDSDFLYFTVNLLAITNLSSPTTYAVEFNCNSLGLSLVSLQNVVLTAVQLGP
jgi:hypothetical protein